MRFAKAFLFGRKGRAARRMMVQRAIAAQEKTGREHGFHAGKAGVDRKLQSGGAGGIKWSPRAAVGQMLRGGDLHHSHPKTSPHLSRQDLRSVVTGANAKGGRNTLWAHSATGHQAAKLSRSAAATPVKQRVKAFDSAFRATRGPGTPQDHAMRLRAELKRRGIIHSSSRFKKALADAGAAIAKAKKFIIRPPAKLFGRKGLPIAEPRPSNAADREAHQGLLEAARMFRAKRKAKRAKKDTP